MRKLKLQVQISLDGYIADLNGKTDWMVWNWGEHWTWDNQLQKDFNELTTSVDCILLSRKMAEEGFINHWATMAENSTNPQSVFAKNITDASKVVFTQTLEKLIWLNTSLAKGNLIDEIHQLKNKNGKDMIVYGGAGFVSSLIQTDLIDEFHLFVNPTVLGKGLSIFKDLDKKLDLTLVKSTPFKCGITVLTYLLKK
jgi:dihydrofolate reductase